MKRLSFEFFPPRTERGHESLKSTRESLEVFHPEFFSVTYGAGGSTRDTTRDTVRRFRQAGAEVAPHLSFGRDTEAELLQCLRDYEADGIRRIVALRGDRSSGSATPVVYARELVAFIRRHFGTRFHLEVAGYPEIHPDADGYDTDIEHLKAKVDAGADSVITQYFFNTHAYVYFLEQCTATGIDAPIYPGIMPITNADALLRFSDVCGADVPRWVRYRIQQYRDDRPSLIAFGIDLISRVCEELLAEGAPGLHFYTMNKVEPTSTIVSNLGMRSQTPTLMTNSAK